MPFDWPVAPRRVDHQCQIMFAGSASLFRCRIATDGLDDSTSAARQNEGALVGEQLRRQGLADVQYDHSLCLALGDHELLALRGASKSTGT